MLENFYPLVFSDLSILLNLLNLLNLQNPGIRAPNKCQDQGYLTLLLDPTQVESKKFSQIQWPVPSINAEPVDIFLGEE